jgi:hypothetical protein
VGDCRRKLSQWILPTNVEGIFETQEFLIHWRMPDSFTDATMLAGIWADIEMLVRLNGNTVTNSLMHIPRAAIGSVSHSWTKHIASHHVG